MAESSLIRVTLENRGIFDLARPISPSHHRDWVVDSPAFSERLLGVKFGNAGPRRHLSLCFFRGPERWPGLSHHATTTTTDSWDLYGTVPLPSCDTLTGPFLSVSERLVFPF